MNKINSGKIFNVAVLLIFVGMFMYLNVISGAFDDMKAGRYQSIFNDYVSVINPGGKQNVLKSSSKKTANKYSTIKTYKGLDFVGIVPPEIYRSSRDNNPMYNVFRPYGRVLFFIYTNSDADDVIAIKNTLVNKFPNSYIDKSINYDSFLSLKSNITPQSSICKSVSDCNEMRKRANVHSQVSLFLENCAKGACIINNRTGKYVKITTKDPKYIIQMLKKYSSW